MKVKHYKKLFGVFFLLSLILLIGSSIPPRVLFGVITGIILAIANGLLYLYASKLIKQGKGEWKPPNKE